jgi:hypothetical protein
LFDSRIAGRNGAFFELLEYAYGLSPTRMVLPSELQGRGEYGFDFLVTITNHPREFYFHPSCLVTDLRQEGRHINKRFSTSLVSHLFP